MPIRQNLNALRFWSKVALNLNRSGVLWFLTDYDGTLTPICSTPELAVLSARMRETLVQLNRLKNVNVCVVSGRSLQSVRKLVGIPALFYIGNHGFEIAGKGIRYTHPKALRARPVMADIRRQLSQSLRSIHGAWVESKGLSLSIHWRKVRKNKVKDMQRICRQVLKPWGKSRRIRTTQGKCVIEVRPPADWDKGKGIDWLLRHVSVKPCDMYLYMGDDRTDEDGFRVINSRKGLSIFVGKRFVPTIAQWRLMDSGQVFQFIRRVSEFRGKNI